MPRDHPGLTDCPATAASPAGRIPAAVALSALCLLAFALRLLPLTLAPSLNWADEIFQATEQAHRLVYGTGLVPWEFQWGTRSWLLPGAIAGVMAFAKLFGNGPTYYLPMIAGACSLLALAPVVCCFLWCRRWFGLPAAIAGGFAVAVAPELVYFGPRTLSEAVAGHLLVLGIFLLRPGFFVRSRARLFASGAVLSLICLLRIQLTPAVALVALWEAIHGWRGRAGAFGVGAASVIAAAALLDWATIGAPLASAWRYVQLNLFEGVSSSFGTAPWFFYGSTEFAVWGAALCPLLLLAFLGCRRIGLPLIAAAVIVATHSLVPHKEYRFIYPALVLLAVQAGLGLACGVRWAEQRLRLVLGKASAGAATAAAASVAWGLIASMVWTGPALAGLRHSSRDHLAAALFAARAHGICGIGLYDPRGHAWARYGGYTYLHRSVPIYWSSAEARLQAFRASADLLLYTAGPAASAPALPPGFRKQRCFGEVCVARRAGTCSPAPMPTLPAPAVVARFGSHRQGGERPRRAPGSGGAEGT